MPIKFTPQYTITDKIAQALMRIEAARQQIVYLPLTPTVLSSLRESARLMSTHYSTMIEGNRLDQVQIESVVKHKGHFPGRERDEKEVKAYYAALKRVEQWAAKNMSISQKIIQTIHALVMADGRSTVTPTSYRSGQNVIKDARTGAIVYLPPEVSDVPDLMKALVEWINSNSETPCPLVAGIAHYQFATIHPYYDGNGRTARLMTTLILHEGGYDLKGLYSLEEYYARDLGGYYQALSIGDSHKYYMGRAEADITPWVEYFVEGMAFACERVLKHMGDAALKGEKNTPVLMKKLDVRQRQALELFNEFEVITAAQLAHVFGISMRTSSLLCKTWVEEGFLVVVNPSKRARTYGLSKKFLPYM